MRIGPLTSAPLSAAPAAAGAFVKVVDAVANLAPKVPTPQTQNPHDVLLDLQIPPSIADVIAPPLKVIGFELTPWDFDDVLDRSHRITTAKRAQRTLYLMHIVAWILQNPEDGNLDAVNSLALSFPSPTVLYLWSEKVDAPALSYDTLFKKWKAKQQITVKFIPWTHVGDLARRPPDKRRTILAELFEIDGAPAGVNGLSARGDLVDRLIDIMAVISANHVGGSTVQQFFQGIVTSSNFPEVSKTEWAAGWKGTPGDMAGALVRWCLKQGGNPADPRYTMLGSICVELMEKVGVEDQKFIFETIIGFELISDAGLIAGLRQKYPAL